MKIGFLIIGIVVVIVVAGALFMGMGNTADLGNDTGQTANTENINEISNSYRDVSAAEAKKLIDENPGLIVIDVSPHYDEGHLPGAINYYPLSALLNAIPTLDENVMYLIYCHADGPSRNGAQALIDAGFTNVYRLESHFGGWVAAGYEIEQ